MTKIVIIFFCVIGLVISLVTCINLPLLTNVWFRTIESEYIIPSESSIIDFTPTIMNSGSGDWWIYGEDKKNYYYFIGSDVKPYVYISKKQASSYAKFDPHNYKTWNLDTTILKFLKCFE